jgi:hypothetical protein
VDFDLTGIFKQGDAQRADKLTKRLIQEYL